MLSENSHDDNGGERLTPSEADILAAFEAGMARENRKATPFHALPLIVPEEEALAFGFDQAWEHIAAIEPRAADPSFLMHFHTEDDKGSQSSKLRRSTDNNLLDVASNWGFSELVEWENGEGKIESRQMTKPGFLTMQSKGSGLFVTVNETKGNHRRRNKDIIAYRSAWCENDNKEGKSLDELLSRFPLRPGLIIESSPEKYHFYWPFKEPWLVNPETEEFWRAIQTRFVEDYGGDIAAMDPARVLRLAGSLHLKREPWRSRIIENNGARFSMVDLAQACKPVLREPKAHGALAITTDPDVMRHDLTEATDALFYLPAGHRTDEGEGYRLWTEPLRALRSFFGDLAFPLWDAWSDGAACSDGWRAPYHSTEFNRAKWTTFADKDAPRERATTLKTIYWRARQNGWKKPGAPRLWNYKPPVITIEGAARIVALPVPAAAGGLPGRAAEPRYNADGTLNTAAPPDVPPFQQPLPETLLPVAPFENDLLPDPLQGWARDTVDRMQCPADFIGAALMVALGSVIGAKVDRARRRSAALVFPLSLGFRNAFTLALEHNLALELGDGGNHVEDQAADRRRRVKLRR